MIFSYYCYDLKHQNSRRKDQGYKKLARALINQKQSDIFWLCQFLQKVYQKLQ